jgi:CubicO group peptidase (beta-lactamase class C family)
MYWPKFGANGKAPITVRQMLTHRSGLRAGLKLRAKWEGYDAGIRLFEAEKPLSAPGLFYEYGDVNFAALGELVRRVSGARLDGYCDRHIFRPLGMRDTGFRPQAALRDRIVPTDCQKGGLRWGEVQDPLAFRMGGVAGHAGLFSTADDLAIFAQAMLNGGEAGGVRVLKRKTVEEMTAPQAPSAKGWRGLGWKLDPPFASNREELPPVGTCSHTGYTGTSLWIDPVTGTYVAILTSRLHPYGKGNVRPLREAIAALVSASLEPLSAAEVLARRPSLAAVYASH